ncbi:MAG TPA: protein kinase [Gemmatimonadales bacterium]
MRHRLAESLAGRYAIERELGRGGMASVWLARDLRHDRPVAIKVLHPELAGVIGVDRFLREIHLTARLQHPGILAVLDSGTLPGPGGDLPWYAMPYIAGESLRDRLAREHQLPVEDALRITEDAAQALAAAHARGVVHRDIKPENLLLSDGRTSVADFGIAKALAEVGGDKLTSTGLAIGTPAYMSPEQSTADAVDARTDQYSLAAVCYEMLAGEPPYSGPTAQAIIARRMAEPVRAIRPIRPTVPESVEQALLRALERVPADRFASVAEFAAALRAPASGTYTAPNAVLNRSSPVGGRAARRLAIAAALALVAIAGWLFSARPSAKAGSPAPRDSIAVELYERGLRAFARRTEPGAVEAIQVLGAAVGRDSAYASAWAALARAARQALGRGFRIPGVSRDSLQQLAVTAVERALALDPADPGAWHTRAEVATSVDPTDNAPVIASLRRALALDSTLPDAWRRLGVAYAELGDSARALTALRRAVAIDPGYEEGLAFLALGHYWRRQYDSASTWADSAVAVNPTFLLARQVTGHVAIERGNTSRAVAAFQAARRLATGVEVSNALSGEALAEARGGNLTAARRLTARADSLALAFDPPVSHTVVYLSQAYAALGDADRAMMWLGRYAPRGDLHFQFHLRCDPPFDALDGDPRFEALRGAPDGARPAC